MSAQTPILFYLLCSTGILFRSPRLSFFAETVLLKIYCRNYKKPPDHHAIIYLEQSPRGWLINRALAQRHI